MMEPGLVAALGPFVAGRVFPSGTVPQGTLRPFITYSHIGGRPIPALCGGGQTNENNVLQIDVWSDTENGGGLAQSATLMRSIHAMLTSAPLRAVSQGEFRHFHDPTTRTDGVSQDFSFWSAT